MLPPPQISTIFINNTILILIDPAAVRAKALYICKKLILYLILVKIAARQGKLFVPASVQSKYINILYNIITL